MAYNDPQFLVTLARHGAPVTGTATASATDGVAVTAQLYSALRQVDISKIRVLVTVVPKTGSMGLVVTVKNGTNTVGVATLGTNTTAGSVKDATLTASNTRIAADSVLTAVITGTATASADTIGTMLLEFDETPVFV